MKEPYEKPDLVSEEIYERTALSCGGQSTSVSPTGSIVTSPSSGKNMDSCSYTRS